MVPQICVERADDIEMELTHSTEKNKIWSLLTSNTMTDSKWIREINVEDKIIKLTEDNVKEKFLLFRGKT